MNGASRHFFEFDTFRMDVEERRLTQNGQAIALTAKVFDILLVLVENAGRTVEKEELMQTVWANTFVEEGNLNRHISTLRKLLGDDPRRQRLIRTIPKHGYRFTAAVHEAVEENKTLAIDNVERSRFVIREETLKGFWTISRIGIAVALLAGIGLLAAWSFTPGSMAMRQKRVEISANPDAAEAYAKGRDLWRNRGAESLHEATLLLEDAVQKDPDFALGHSALADAYAFDYTNWKKAETEANTAIKLDAGLGEPHASIGFINMFWRWNLSGAEDEFKQAVTLSPDYATGHQWYAADLAATGHFDAALSEIKRALELDPSSIAIHADQCQLLYFARHYTEALTECRRTLELDPGFVSAHVQLYEIYSLLGMNNDAVNKFFENAKLRRQEVPAAVEETLRHAYAVDGIDGFRRAQLLAHTNENDYQLAKTYARLGNIDKAINALVSACDKQEFDFVFAGTDPVFAQLQTDPRMRDLVAKLRGTDTE